MQNVLFYLKKYGKDLVIFLLLILCIILICYKFYIKKDSNTNNNVEIATLENEVKEVETLNKSDVTNVFIDIKGAVKKPGVYEVSENAIINDAIKLAGGFNNNAYINGINLSKKVSNEMVIFVYTKDEVKKNDTKVETVQDTCAEPSYTITECVYDKASIITSDGNSKPDEKQENAIVNINTASEKELLTLSGIGESKAKAIIEYRKNTLFQNPQDIMKVSGIGEALYAKIKDSITV